MAKKLFGAGCALMIFGVSRDRRRGVHGRCAGGVSQ